MVTPLEHLLGSAYPFLEKICAFLEKDCIDVSAFELDHICYRVETIARYAELKAQLDSLGSLLSEAMIGGRPISTYKLFQPLVFGERIIHLLELPSPKASSFYPEGWEHVEFVIDTDFEAFISKYPSIAFDLSAINKPVNADISINYEGCAVKFHRHHLEYVIKYLD